MNFTVLCTPYFSAKEEAEIEAAAKKLNVSKDQLIRAAVSFYSSECVPTHSRKAKAPVK